MDTLVRGSTSKGVARWRNQGRSLLERVKEILINKKKKGKDIDDVQRESRELLGGLLNMRKKDAEG